MLAEEGHGFQKLVVVMDGHGNCCSVSGSPHTLAAASQRCHSLIEDNFVDASAQNSQDVHHDVIRQQTEHAL